MLTAAPAADLPIIITRLDDKIIRQAIIHIGPSKDLHKARTPSDLIPRSLWPSKIMFPRPSPYTVRQLSENNPRISARPLVRWLVPSSPFRLMAPLLALGAAIAKAERSLVYGGGTKGLMGVVAGAVLNGGGSVTGIVPFAISRAGGEGGEGKPSAPGVEGALHHNSRRVETVGAIIPVSRLNPNFGQCRLLSTP
jgi:hypothetical protein